MNETDAILFLREKLGKQGQLVLPQVRNATGFAARTRTADAIVAETWPSRGLSFTGVEYKKNLYDWRRELANPEKADEIGAYCKYWVVLAPADVVPLGEVPETWGLWEIRGKQLMRTKSPPPTEYEPPTAAFVCAMLRANSKYDPSITVMNDIRAKARAEAEAHFKKRVESLENENREMEQKMSDFAKRSGIDLRYAPDVEKIGDGIGKYLRDPEFVKRQLGYARNTVASVLQSLDSIIEGGK
jgi:hypothetical protein